MKRLINIGLLIGIALSAFAQAPAYAPEGTPACEKERQLLKAPYFYCQCEEESIDFSFPMELEVKDTMWFTSKLDDILQGITAYWFSSDSVTLEAYALCTSKEPTLSFTIYKNAMREIDPKKIKEKMQEAGDYASALSELEPKLRIYTGTKGGTGKVYCYPYDQGPKSECDDPLPLYNGMAYVVDTTENVYRMADTSIPSTGKAFIHWKQLQSKPCEIWLTLDSCTGDTIGQAVLTDSLHVYQPSAALLTAARNAHRSLWLHIRHEPGITGRLYWRSFPAYNEPLPAIDYDTCMHLGQAFTIDNRTYTRDTVFNDTLWVTTNRLTTRQLSIHFTPPAIEFDTIYRNKVTIKEGYLFEETGDAFFTFGDYIITIEKEDACTRIVQLSIIQEEIPTICDTPYPLSAGSASACVEVETVYRLEPASLPSTGKAFIRWYQKSSKPSELLLTLDSCQGEVIGHALFTDNLHVYLPDEEAVMKAKEGNHSVWLYISHAKDIVGTIGWFNNPTYTTAALVDKTDCQGKGKKITVNNRTYTKDTIFTDTLYVSETTLKTKEVHIRFTPPKLELDTVRLTETEMAKGYKYSVSGKTYSYNDFGDYQIKIEQTNTCTRLIQLTIEKKEEIPTIIKNTADSTRQIYKRIENGQLIIIVDDHKYTLMGQQIN